MITFKRIFFVKKDTTWYSRGVKDGGFSSWTYFRGSYFGRLSGLVLYETYIKHHLRALLEQFRLEIQEKKPEPEFLLVGVPTSICHFFRLSVRLSGTISRE